MKSYPWLNNKSVVSRDSPLAFKENWLNQREKGEEIIMVVPSFYIEEAKRIILPLEDEMQLPLEWQLERNPLYLFTRFIKPTSGKPGNKLAEAYIPHCIINGDKQIVQMHTGLYHAKVDIYYWERPATHMLHTWMPIDTREGIQRELSTLDGFLWQMPWEKITDEANQLKTLRLLKGNDDGLPKTYVEGQNWSFI